MNGTIYLAECIGSVSLFTAAILIPLVRNPVWWIHDYPPDIQEKYFETHERIPVKLASRLVLMKKGAAILVCALLLTFLSLLSGARSFTSAFLAGYGLWLIVDWYDCLFLDWVLFANMRCIRLPGTEEMDQAYHEKKYHAVQSAIGMALGVIPCLLSALLVQWIVR